VVVVAGDDDVVVGTDVAVDVVVVAIVVVSGVETVVEVLVITVVLFIAGLVLLLSSQNAMDKTDKNKILTSRNFISFENNKKQLN